VPPAGILVKIAEVTGADLTWLLTGHAAGEAVDPSHPALRRAAALLDACPDAAGPLLAFVELLAEVHELPELARAFGQAGAPGTTADSGLSFAAAGDAGADESAVAGGQAVATLPAEVPLIPVLGRSAAGVPQFWAAGEAAGVTSLADLVQRYAGRAVRTVQVGDVDTDDAGRDVEIITLRVDGESMAPEIRHGDLVILSPSRPAADGRAAVAQLAGQIGVTCKLFRSVSPSTHSGQGAAVHLVAINEQIAPVSVEADRVVWALQVLARIRPRAG